MIKPLVFATLAILAASCVAQAYKLEWVHDLDSAELDGIKKLAPKIVKISRTLAGKFGPRDPNVSRAQRTIDLAKAELEELNSGCFGVCLKKSKRKALELFALLGETVLSCNKRSYEILAMNYIVHQEAYPHALITYQAFENYRAEHAKFCRPVYKKQVEKLTKSMPEAILVNLENAFAALTLEAFEEKPAETYGKPSDLIFLGSVDFTNYKNRRPLELIIGQFKHVADAHKLPQSSLYYYLSELLFKPCKIYRSQLGDILDAARFDAAYEDGQAQWEFFYGDKVIHDALVYNKLCTGLLKAEDELYNPLSIIWSGLP